MYFLHCQYKICSFNFTKEWGILVMKNYVKFMSALLLVIMMCSVASAAVPSVMMLSTKTCPACEQMAKVINELDTNYKGRLSTSRVYLEHNPEIAKKYNVRYVPMLIFRDASGEIISKEIGYRSVNEVLTIFENAGIKI